MSSPTAALRRFKRSARTRARSRTRTRRRGVSIGPFTKLLGVSRWRIISITPDAILSEACLLCKVLLLVLATMRPRRKQDAAPRL
eukprot:336003-Pleurochrysis_carterae.AAC.5